MQSSKVAKIIFKKSLKHIKQKLYTNYWLQFTKKKKEIAI